MVAIAVPALAAVSILIAVAVHRPMRPIPWVLLGVGLGAAAAARAVAAHDWYGSKASPSPGPVRRTACSPIHRCSWRRSASRLIGVALRPAGGVGADHLRDRPHRVVWMAVTGPYVDDGTLPLDARGWIWVFLLLDGLLALIVLRRTSRNDPPPLVPSDGLRPWGAAHAAVGWTAYQGDFEPARRWRRPSSVRCCSGSSVPCRASQP